MGACATTDRTEPRAANAKLGQLLYAVPPSSAPPAVVDALSEGAALDFLRGPQSVAEAVAEPSPDDVVRTEALIVARARLLHGINEDPAQFEAPDERPRGRRLQKLYLEVEAWKEALQPPNVAEPVESPCHWDDLRSATPLSTREFDHSSEWSSFTGTASRGTSTTDRLLATSSISMSSLVFRRTPQRNAAFTLSSSLSGDAALVPQLMGSSIEAPIGSPRGNHPLALDGDA